MNLNVNFLKIEMTILIMLAYYQHLSLSLIQVSDRMIMDLIQQITKFYY